MNIRLLDNDYNYTYEGLNYNRYKNITNYKYIIEPYNNSKREVLIIDYNGVENEISKDEIDIYYIFEVDSDAFAHWVYESLIYYPYFLNLIKKYPNIKILTRNKKKYVSSYFNFLNINNDIVEKIENKNNICFFPTHITTLIGYSLDKNIFLKYINNYLKDVEVLIPKINNYFKRKNNIVLLPRNKKDNFNMNDREVPGIEDIEENIINIGGVVLNTYEINNISLQFSIISLFDIIILDYGSSFFVNCLFLKDKKIILLENYKGLIDYQINNHSIGILYNIIKDRNNLIIVNSSNNTNYIGYDDIKSFI